MTWEEELQVLQVRAETDQGYKNCYWVNHHCKHQVILLKTTLIQELLKHWCLVSHIFSTSVLLNLFPLQASLSPESWQQPLSWGKNPIQAELEKLHPNLEPCPFSWDSVTGHVKQPVVTQSKGKHFYLNNLRLFKATLLWFALEEPRHAYDSLYEESSSSQLWLWSAPMCIFIWFHFFRKGCEFFLSCNIERLGQLASLQASSRAVSQLKLLHLDPVVVWY